MPDKRKIEGEGSYSGAREYDERTKKFLSREGERVQEIAEDAADALEGEEGKALRQAEETGKRPARR